MATTTNPSSAELTVKHSILSGIAHVYHLNSKEKTIDSIFERLFDPSLRWAVEEYLKELKDKEK